MKKVLLTLVCVFALTLGSVAAQAETTGIYVAPKFMMLWQNNWSNMDADVASNSFYSAQSNASLGKSQFTLGGALAVGYDFWPQHKLPIRAEIEFAMRGNNKMSDDYSASCRYKVGGDTYEEISREEINITYNASTLLANFYWDFHNSTAFTPYVMAGAGLAFINAEYEHNVSRKGAMVGDTHGDLGSTSYSEHKNYTNFAWALGAGCAYNVNENFAIDLGYRYLNLGTVETDGSHSGSFATARTPLTKNPLNINFDGNSFASNHEIMLGLRYTF